MKLSRFLQVATLGLIVAVAATGCRSKQGYFTRIPGDNKTPTPARVGSGMQQNDTDRLQPLNRGNGATGSEVTSIPADPGATQAAKQNAGIPLGPGHPGWIEDRNALQGETVHFAYDSSSVTSADKSKVGAVAEYLKSNPVAAVKIEGHCDERGTAEYNRALGERRALALREELVGLGVASDRLDTMSYGFDKPVAVGHDESAWSQNRRGEFIVLTPPVQ
jgi:peptidoglycan-associated lipoprotein